MELNENNRPLTEVPANEMPETSVQSVADASQARYPQRKSKEEVIERLKEIIADNCNADKQEIDLLKQTFYKLHKAEQDAAQKDFVNNGGIHSETGFTGRRIQKSHGFHQGET